jgi:hypothetical protein
MSQSGIWIQRCKLERIFAYFFKASKYVKYDIRHDKLVPGYPAPINGNWHKMPDTFTKDVDAVVVWPDGYAYFFKGRQYVKYDIQKDEAVESYRLPIYGNSRHLTTTFSRTLDDDMLITNNYYWKNTCRVLPPSSTDKGKILLLPGQNGYPQNEVIRRSIIDNNGKVDYATPQ